MNHPYFKNAVGVLCLFFGLSTVSLAAQDWSEFRGSGGTNVADDSKVPLKISDTENLAWKVELPGRGPSGPLVLNDRVYVTCSAGDNQDQLYVVCMDANSGEKVWQRRFWATGRCFCHPLSANAAPTPCTDGEFIYAFYSSNDIFCLDLDGNLMWCRGLAVDHPKAGHDTGMSSSPVVFNGTVVCQVENEGDSFVVGLDTKDGTTKWEIEREKEISWASPVIFNKGGENPYCLLQSQDRSTVVHLSDGTSAWEKSGEGHSISSPVVVGNRVFVPIDGLTVIEFDETNDHPISEVMNSSRIAAGSQSNIIHQDKIYSFGRGGIMTCSDINSGDEVWKARVGGQHWTTPVVANGHMFFFDQEGKATVVNVEGEFEDAADRIVHTFEFDGEVFLGSPAISGDAMFMRSDKFLYKFAKQGE